jgi:hypothetical protein
MKKMLAMVALATGLMFGSVANAADIDIFLSQNGSSTSWDLTVANNTASGVGAVNMLIAGLDVLSINPLNTNISGPDSVLSIDPLGDGSYNFLVLNNNPGTAIAPAGVTTLLATLSGPGPVSATGSEDILGSPTVFDTAGEPFVGTYSITVVPTPVPEPATLLMLGLGLAGLAMVRRSA